MKSVTILFLFLVMTVAMTYPLIMYMATAIAGPPGDGFIHLYEMYWFKRAIFDLHVWPLFNAETFYPFGYNLALSHITPANTLPMMPVVMVGGPVVGFNVAVFLSFILSGFGAYLLVLSLTCNRWAGILAGILFAFSAYRFHNLGAGWLPNLGTQWLPFVFLYLDKLIMQRTSPWRVGGLAGFFFALCCLSSWYHMYIVALAAGVYLLARGWPWRQRLFNRRILDGMIVLSIVAALMVAPAAFPLLLYGATEKGVDWPLISADNASASIDDLFLPSAFHPLWGDLALQRRKETHANIIPGMVYLGIPALFLAFYALRQRIPGAGSWTLVGITAAVLTLGLTLHINGQRIYIPVPAAVEEVFSRGMLKLAGQIALNPGSYWAFRSEEGIPVILPGMFFSLFLPFGRTLRVFHRFGLASSLGIAVLAGLGAAALLVRVERRGQVVTTLVTAGLLGVALLDVTAVPWPYGFSDATGLSTDHWLKQQSGDFSVLHLPLVRGLNGPGLYRAAIHGKKISYGYGTFFPNAWREAMTPFGNFPNPEAIACLRAWNVRYILLGEGAYKAGLVDAVGDSWEKVQERLAKTPELRYVRTFDEESPVFGDRLSPKLTDPWPVAPVKVDRTHVYEVLP